MLYSLGREDQSVAEWTRAVAPLLESSKNHPAPAMSEFVGIWSKAVSYLGEAELYARAAERREVFGVDSDGLASARRRAEVRNDRGIEALGVARDVLGRVREQIADTKVDAKDEEGDLDVFRDELFWSLSDVEMKKSDAEQLRDIVNEAIETTRSGGLVDLFEWADGQLAQGIEYRRQPTRGADTNFAKWKLVAVIALLVGLGIAFWIHCGWFSCSVSSRNNYIAAILTVAGLWWC